MGDQQMADVNDEGQIVPDFGQGPRVQNLNEPRVQQPQRLMISISLGPDEPMKSSPENLHAQRSPFFGTPCPDFMMKYACFAGQNHSNENSWSTLQSTAM